MNYVIAAVGFFVLLVLVIVLGPAVSALMGYFSGWVLADILPGVGDYVVMGANTLFGVELVRADLKVIGAFVAWISSIVAIFFNFKSSSNNNKKNS